jgi:hypothetical protein
MLIYTCNSSEFDNPIRDELSRITTFVVLTTIFELSLLDHSSDYLNYPINIDSYSSYTRL